MLNGDQHPVAESALGSQNGPQSGPYPASPFMAFAISINSFFLCALI